jgi:GntR family transcriptional regulator
MEKKQSIDFESHIPYYLQLIELLKEQILQQKWVPGDQIPGEQDLGETYGISRTVIRQALRELELEGIITRHKGKGTFVAWPKINEGLIHKLTGFYQDMLDRGIKPSTKVLHQNITSASEKVAQFLKIDPGTEVIDVQRLRYVNDEPIQLVTSYIPYHICPSLATIDLTDRSLYQFLETECGIFLARGRRYIEAISASGPEAALLEVESGAPLLILESISYAEGDLPIEYYHALHRGDRSRFEVELVRSRDQNQEIPPSLHLIE